jgi:transposase-like protein
MKASVYYNSLRLKIIAYYFEEGCSIQKLADEFGINPATLKYWIDTSKRNDK